MKKMDISRLEQNRSTNLRIGFVAALSLMLFAFTWTEERAVYEDPFGDVPATVDLKITRTVQEPAKELPPPPKPTIKNKVIIESEVPDLVSTEIKWEEPAPQTPDDGIGEIAQPVVTQPPVPRPKIVNEELPFVIIAEDMPLFGDCNQSGISKQEKKKCSDRELMKYLSGNLHYPSFARDNGIEGMVVIQFIVEKDGSISKPKVMRDIGGGCGAEALRVVKSMPDWEPGKQRGREVRVQYNLPVKFKLN